MCKQHSQRVPQHDLDNKKTEIMNLRIFVGQVRIQTELVVFNGVYVVESLLSGVERLQMFTRSL